MMPPLGGMADVRLAEHLLMCRGQQGARDLPFSSRPRWFLSPGSACPQAARGGGAGTYGLCEADQGTGHGPIQPG
eukprot:11225874-Lingulodinium_polyedra.AAC.1